MFVQTLCPDISYRAIVQYCGCLQPQHTIHIIIQCLWQIKAYISITCQSTDRFGGLKMQPAVK